MLARRRFMGDVPDGMIPIEYLEVNAEGGASWIDTGYAPTGTEIDIFCEFMLLGYTNSQPIWFGNFQNESKNNNSYRVFGHSNTIDRISVSHRSNFGVYANIYGIEINVKYNISILKNGQFAFNQIEGNNYMAGNFNDIPIIIFDYRFDNGIATFGRCYSFRIDKAGVTELDLIPVRVGDEGFMYDKVSGRLLGNSGSGRFILGPDLA